MLKLTIKKLMLAKGVAKPHAFLVKQGVNRNTATKILSSSYKNIKLEHLELLCWFLSCTPNELLEWEPTAKYPDMPGHPLQQIRAQLVDTNLPKFLKKLSKEQLTELSRQAIGMIIENEGGKKDGGE